MAPRTRTRLAREERREQIVDAAADVFVGRDPAEVTFEEIADAAGVSRALVYNYFGDRHGLLEAVYQRNVERLQGEVFDALVGRTADRDALRAAVVVHLRFAQRDPAAYRYAAGQVRFPRLPELLLLRVERLAELFGASDESIVVARGLLAAVEAMVLQWLDDPRWEADTAADVITSFLWDGMRGVDRLGLAYRPPQLV